MANMIDPNKFLDVDEATEGLLTKHDSLALDGRQDPRVRSKHEDLEKAIPRSKEDPVQNREQRGWRWSLVVCAVASVMFFYCLDKSVTTIIVPIIVSELGEASKLPWIFVGFGMGSLSLALPIGKLYGLYNAKQLYLGFLSAFLIGSALCGTAWNMNALIVGRIIAGMGGIGMYTGIMTLITTLTTPEERPLYLGVIGLFWSIGRVVGPIFGGMLGKGFWRWGFLVNLIVCGAFLPVYIYLLPDFHPLPNVPLFDRLRKFDFLGCFLNIISIVSLFMGLNFGGTQYDWDSGTMKLIFSVAILAIICFGFQQWFCYRTSEADRIFPVNMLLVPEACLVFIISSTSSIAGFLPAQFCSLYFQFTRGDSALEAAIRLLPMIIAMSLVLPLSGYLIPKIGYLEWWPIVGSMVALPGMLMMVSVKVTSSPMLVYVGEALIGAGMGSYMQVAYSLIGAYVPKSEKHASTSFIIISQTGGIAFSLSLAGAIFTNLAINQLATLLPSHSKSQIEKALSGTSGDFLTTIPAETLDAVLETLVTSMRPAWLIGYTCIVMGLIASLTLIMLNHLRKRKG